MTNIIPVMDDPLGAHWDQPKDIRTAEMDDTHVILTPQQIKGLCNYDSTLPSGVYPGKCWLRKERHRTLLAWYGPETPDHMCPIMFREVLDLSAPPPVDWRARAEAAEATLKDIGDWAHDRSTGPAVPDDLWEVRRMAYDL